MASVLLSALAGLGAAGHMRSLAEALRDRGHDVAVLTTDEALEPYRAAGFDTHPTPEPPMPELLQHLPPVAQRARQLLVRVQRNIIEPLPQQWAVVDRVLRERAVDVVVTDGLFLGASMLASRPRPSRPPVIMLGFHPPWLPDPQVPPFGMGIAPSDAAANRLTAAVFATVAARAMAVLSLSFNTTVYDTFGTDVHGDLRTSPGYADVWAQLTVDRFEYPRRALPSNFRFVGPLHPPAAEQVPEWWEPLREPPVVAVRAVDDRTLRDLVLPVLTAFGDTDSTVVVAGVGRAATAAAAGSNRIPDNVHFEDQLPWPRLFPDRTVLVSDGDYLHTQHALRHGIPLVLAGTLETDVETAARVAWTGAGIDLRTSSPSPGAIARAVATINGGATYRAAAARIAARIATTDAETTICDLVEQAITDGARSTTPLEGRRSSS